MKDLKHLLYFENLLQEAQNELILQAQSDGKVCVAYVCENTPEPLLNLPGAFSTRLRAPRTGSMEMATYYMTSFLCEYSRALLERAIEGGYNFADCLITPDGCTMMNRAVENMELLKALGKGKEKFFFEYMEIPMKADDNGLNLYTLQCTNHILKPLHEHYGIDISDKAIRQAVAEHNRICELIRAIGEYRKCGILTPEFSWQWVDREMDHFATRLQDPYIMTDDQHRFVREKIEVLEHHAHLPAVSVEIDLLSLRVFLLCNVRPLHDHAAGGRRFEQIERAQECRLAAAGGPDDDDHVTLADREIHAVERFDRTVAEVFAEVFDLNERFTGLHGSSSFQRIRTAC